METIKAFPQRPKTPEFILDLEHFTQVNNTGGEGYRECNLTVCTMLANYLLGGVYTQAWKSGKIKQPEDLYATQLADYGDTTDHGAQTAALESIGIRSYFSYTASLNDVASSLFCGVPVVIGEKYKADGHMALIVGRDSKGFLVKCPYGIRNGSTDNWIKIFQSEAEAETDHFSWDLLKRIFTDMGPEKGWARFVTHVNGVPTGVKSGF
jgi:hypothetical protein